jgi:hypothetical protein
MTRSILNIGVGLVVIAFVAAQFAIAQSTLDQAISGTIRDSSGAVVPKAKVSVREESTNLSRPAISDAAGFYQVSGIPIGIYEVSATAPGFKKSVIARINVTVNAKVTQNIVLQVGSVSQSVTVNATAEQVQASTGQVSWLVTGRQATQIQLNGRNFPQLLALLPGVSTTYSSGFTLLGGYGMNNSGQSVNGEHTDTTTWNLDGVDNKDNGGGGNNFVDINPDAIGEFSILTSNYSAKYGTSSGAVINLAMKSGTNQFHGEAYEYFRNNAIQAVAFNAVTIPELRWNNFGADIGGPVLLPGVKHKMYFFFSTDFKRLVEGSAETWLVPTVAEREGDFSSLPSLEQPDMPGTTTPFPGGIVPSADFNSNIARLIQNYPKPNADVSGGNYVFNIADPLSDDEYIGTVNYNLSTKNQLAFHFGHDGFAQLQNQTDLILYNRVIPAVNTSLEWTFVPNPTTVNTAQVSFSGNVINQDTDLVPNPLFITNYTRAGEGINYPMLYNASDAIPSLNISGFTGLSASPYNWNNFNRIFDWKDDFSKIIGNHDLQTGILVMRSRKNQDNVPAINGSFCFSPAASDTTGNALADALLGNFYSYTEASGFQQGWYRFSQVEPYVQDDWKVSKRLTLNLGLRYAYMQPQYSALNNTSAFLPQYYNPAEAPTINPSTGEIVPGTGNPYNGLVLGGSGFPSTAKGRLPQYNEPAVTALFHNLPLGTAYTDWDTPAPRVGLAYDLTGHGNTVLRGGFGVFYERVEGNFIFSAVDNPPFIEQATVYNASAKNPSGGVSEDTPSSINNSHYLNYGIPQSFNWSLGIQRLLTPNTRLDVSYVGSSGDHQSWQQDINQLLPGTTFAHPGVNVNALRPYPGYADIWQYQTGGNFNYNSLQVQLKKQMRRGILGLAYTWSKALTDDNSYSYEPEDSYCLDCDYGPSSYNREQVFVASYVYPLPFFSSPRNWYQRYVLGGWQLSGVTTIESGLPLNPTIQPDALGLGSGSGGERPNLVGSAFAGTHGTQYLNPAAFAAPADGVFGTLGPFALFGPGADNWDAALQKDFPLGERVHLNFRAEFFDFPNHMSHFGVATTVGASNFGQVDSAMDPRTLEFALRLGF